MPGWPAWLIELDYVTKEANVAQAKTTLKLALKFARVVSQIGFAMFFIVIKDLQVLMRCKTIGCH